MPLVDIAETDNTKKNSPAITNLDYFPAPSLPAVAPELEVPELLSEGGIPLCLTEQHFLKLWCSDICLAGREEVQTSYSTEQLREKEKVT